MKALKTNAVDRYVMAAALVEAGCDTTFGDLMFSLGIYPLGAEQDNDPEPKWTKYYNEATVIAGDFVSIRASMPDDLTGKIVVTNTTTAKNVEELRERGLHILATSTPRLEGRTFGTNVMEATLRALSDKPDDEI